VRFLSSLAVLALPSLLVACFDFDQFSEGGAPATGGGGAGAAGGNGGEGAGPPAIDPACVGVTVPARVCAFGDGYEFGTGYEDDWDVGNEGSRQLRECVMSSPSDLDECALRLGANRGKRVTLSSDAETSAPEDACFAAIRIVEPANGGWAFLGLTSGAGAVEISADGASVRFLAGSGAGQIDQIEAGQTVDALRILMDDGGTTQLEALAEGDLVACRRFATPNEFSSGFTTRFGVDATDADAKVEAAFRQYGAITE
jgi:hypothetical protein